MNALNTAISIVGSQQALADQIGVVQSAVANWLKRGNVPSEHCLAIENATAGKVTRRDLRPDDCHRIWPDLAGAESPAADPPAVKPKGPLRRATGQVANDERRRDEPVVSVGGVTLTDRRSKQGA